MINNRKKVPQKYTTGFTLLELLIVIAIIAVLSALLIFVLNPAETLRKGRDTQRLSDLQTTNSALALLLVTNSGVVGTDLCGAGDKIYVTIPSGSPAIPGGCYVPGFSPGATCPNSACFCGGFNQVAAPNAIDGSGWIPVDLTAIPDGSPISRFPVDPTNDINKEISPDNCPDVPVRCGPEGQPEAFRSSRDLYYSYACNQSNLTWEINASLESEQFSVTELRDDNDGGNNVNRYEIGTNLSIIP